MAAALPSPTAPLVSPWEEVGIYAPRGMRVGVGRSRQGSLGISGGNFNPDPQCNLNPIREALDRPIRSDRTSKNTLLRHF